MEADATEKPVMVCPACGAGAPGTATWCEACGADLDASVADATPAASCVACGAPPEEIAEDLYCMRCGHKQPSKRDHLVIDHEVVAGVSDRGKRHHQNEDAFAVAVRDNGLVIVVCDGVSSTDNPQEASQRAADIATTSLAAALDAGSDQLEDDLVDAVAAAHASVVEIPLVPGGQGAPSCTFVAAVVQPDTAGVCVTLGWLGDSRAYAITADGITQLTTDHSWLTEVVAAGEVTAEQALLDPRAHSITRWIGADAANIVPDTTTFQFGQDIRLLLCSDGLWNYASTDAQMLEICRRFAASPVQTAEALTEFANEAGGHDNITAVVVDVPAWSIQPATAVTHNPDQTDNPDQRSLP